MFIKIKVRARQYEKTQQVFPEKIGPEIFFSDLTSSCSEVAINNSKTNKSVCIGMPLFLDTVLLT